MSNLAIFSSLVLNIHIAQPAFFAMITHGHVHVPV